MTRQATRRGGRSKAVTSRRAVAAQVMAAMVILALGLWVFQRGGYFRPIGFPADQVYAHLPTNQPERLRGVIRVPAGDVDRPYLAAFGIVVDRDGRPGSVELIPTTDPREAPTPAMTDSAITQIQTWRFVPFEINGRPVYGRVVAGFFLVPEQDRPSVRVPFPAVADVSKVVMTYDERGLKRLPRSVTVHGDGQVEIAIASVRSTQHFPAAIPQEKVLSLIGAFRRADFFSLKDGYGGGPTEGTDRTVSITIDGQTKTIRDYEGQFGGLPDAVMDIEEAIQRAGGLEP